jgi:hypothetical protein
MRKAATQYQMLNCVFLSISILAAPATDQSRRQYNPPARDRTGQSAADLRR